MPVLVDEEQIQKAAIKYVIDYPGQKPSSVHVHSDSLGNVNAGDPIFYQKNIQSGVRLILYVISDDNITEGEVEIR